MKVKIKNQNELIDATIEMIDGIMVVSPKKVFEPKDGDIIYVNASFKFIAIYREVDTENKICTYAALCTTTGRLYPSNGGLCSKREVVEIRPATENEKQKLYKVLANEGLEWDVKERKFVKLKWKPKYYERYYAPVCDCMIFEPCEFQWRDTISGNSFYEKGWAFPFTEQGEADCQKLADKLNEVINSVKL